MPDIAQQRARAEAFRNMHRGRLLLLPNAWDVASARIFEDGGFAAIATTSAGIAFAIVQKMRRSLRGRSSKPAPSE